MQFFHRWLIVEGYFKEENYQTRVYRTEEYIAVVSNTHIFEKLIHCMKDLTSERLLILPILSKWKITIRLYHF